MAITRKESAKIAVSRKQYNYDHWREHLLGGVGFLLVSTYVITGGVLGAILSLLGAVMIVIGTVNGIKHLIPKKFRENLNKEIGVRKVTKKSTTTHDVDEDENEAKLEIIKLGFKHINHFSISDQEIMQIPDKELKRYYETGLAILKK